MESPSTASLSDEQILEWYLGTLRVEGWRVISTTQACIFLEKPRRLNIMGLLACLLLVSFGVFFYWLPPIVAAVLGMLLLLVDYFRQRPATMEVNVETARAAARTMEGGYMEK
jgi:hypothetical protein